MKTLRTFSIATLLATSLSGCVIVAGDHDFNDSWEKTQKDNRQMISELVLQSPRANVETKMGSPNFTEAFMKGDDEYRVLYYRTQRRNSDGETTKDETTPLIFKNDKLIGWGDEVLASVK